MDVREVVKKVKQPAHASIWYKYDGHGGYQPPDQDWRKGVACFSTVCKDETKTLCRISNPREGITKKQWKDMVRMVKKVSSGVRKCLVENPPSYEEHTMMFNSGHGYSDYFAFSLFRMFYYDYAYFKIIQYLHQTAGYHLVDAYILAGVYRPKNWWEGTHYMIVGKAYQNRFVQRGMAKRLKNASRFRNIRPYGMRLAMAGFDLRGRMPVDGLNLTMANLKKTDFLDKIVAHINS